MHLNDIKDKIEKRIKNILKSKNLEFYKFDIRNKNNSVAIEVLADKERGGITIGECADVNKKIVEDSDINNFLPKGYIVEVSSPGLDTPLKSERDFKRVLGLEIEIYLSEHIEGRMQYSGKLKSVNNGNILVEVGIDTIPISINKINKAVQRI